MRLFVCIFKCVPTLYMQMTTFKENTNPDLVRMDFIQEGVLPGWGRGRDCCSRRTLSIGRSASILRVGQKKGFSFPEGCKQGWKEPGVGKWDG